MGIAMAANLAAAGRQVIMIAGNPELDAAERADRAGRAVDDVSDRDADGDSSPVGELLPDFLEALESGISIESPSGTVTMDGPSHHVIQNTYFAQANDSHGFTIVGDQKAVPPAFEKEKCDLIRNPGLHTQFLPGQ